MGQTTLADAAALRSATESGLEPGQLSAPRTRETLAFADRNAHLDAVGALTMYLVLLFLIPAQWVFPGLGAAGRPAGVFGLGLLALWMVAKILRNVERRRSPLRWFLAAFGIAMLTSYSLAYDRGLPAIEALAADRAMISLASLTGLVLITAEGLPTLAHVNKLVTRLTYLSTGVVIIAIIQFLFKVDFFAMLRFPGLVLNDDVNSLRTRGSGGLVRVKGSMTHPIEFGVVMGMVLPYCLHTAFHEPELGRRRLRFIMAGLHAAAAAMAVSRSAVLALVTGLAVMFWGWSPLLRAKAIVAGLLFTVLLRGAIPGLLGTILALFRYWNQDPSIQARTDDYDVVGQYIADRPLFGRGPDTFIPSEYLVLDNAYLLGVISIGFVGMAALVLLLLGAVWQSRVAIKTNPNNAARHLGLAATASIAVALTTSATFDFFAFPAATSMAFLSVGVAGATALAVDRPLGGYYAPPDLLRLSYRYGYPNVPWWHRFDPELRQVLRRDNRLAGFGQNLLWLRTITVALYPYSQDIKREPYLALLNSCLSNHRVVAERSTVVGLFIQPADVIHIQRIEQRLRGRLPDRVRGVLMLPGLLIARRRGSVVVYTAPSGSIHAGTFMRRYLRLFDRLVDATIVMTRADVVPLATDRPRLLRRPILHIRHGHMKPAIGWQPAPERARRDLRLREVDGPIVAIIDRPADGVDIEPFLGAVAARNGLVLLPDADWTSDAALKEHRSHVRRISVEQNHELLSVLAAADLVVVPSAESIDYRRVLFALSANRRTLTQNHPQFKEMAMEVGSQWLFVTDDPFDPQAADSFLASQEAPEPPSLEKLSWELLGGSFRTAYEAVLSPGYPTPHPNIALHEKKS